ncbi:TniQ family protein [Roseateles sp.]|uniref:TniQ family protein n=1 Tax=Roseateles sp. TaxID=1971397 RepID=UPI003264B025
MADELFFLLRPEFPAPTPMYGRRPMGEGTGDIESLFSHFLSLSHDHRLTPKKVIDLVLPEVLAKLSRFDGTRLGWGWDKNAGKEMIGSGHVAERWSTILSSATGQTGLQLATMVPLAAHVYGDMTTDQDRVCHQCLGDDEAQGRLPYGRLLWRMKCVACCPTHRCALVTPVCGRPPDTTKRQFLRVKLAGVCSDCGSIGHRCNTAKAPIASADEVWRAEQCRRMITAFPAIEASDPAQLPQRIKEYCAEPGSLTSLALRSGATISVLSRWINQPGARLTFDQILDICGTEGLELAALLQGRIEKTDSFGTPVAPKRIRRVVRPANHEAIRTALKAAVETGDSVTSVAERLRVDIATLAQHADLYAEVRMATRNRKAASDTARQDAAIAKAEGVAIKLLRDGRRLTPRNAKGKGAYFYPSTVEWTVLALIRIGLGDRSVRHPTSAVRMSDAFLSKIEAAARRVRATFGETQAMLLLDYR